MMNIKEIIKKQNEEMFLRKGGVIPDEPDHGIMRVCHIKIRKKNVNET